MLACAVEGDVFVPEIREAIADALEHEIWRVAVRAQVTEHEMREIGVGDVADELVDLLVG